MFPPLDFKILIPAFLFSGVGDEFRNSHRVEQRKDLLCLALVLLPPF